MLSFIRQCSSIVIAPILLSACGENTIVDNWPTYVVRGVVRTSGGAPAPAVLVELETYSDVGCGEGPLFAWSPAKTDLAGRYQAQQDEFDGMLDGCLRVTSSVSEPTAIVDLLVDNIHVIEGETIFSVDLILP